MVSVLAGPRRNYLNLGVPRIDAAVPEEDACFSPAAVSRANAAVAITPWRQSLRSPPTLLHAAARVFIGPFARYSSCPSPATSVQQVCPPFVSPK